MKRSDLIEKIKRRLGYPMIKVELDDSQIIDHIGYARQKFIKWAVGQSTQEYYFTQMLSGGQSIYEMPDNVTEVINYDVQTTGKINTLFTIENYLYNIGMFDDIIMRGGSSGYTMISYHIARDFLDMVRRYTVDSYNYTYHPYDNTIEINPTPPSGGSVTVDDVVYDSPGFILIRAFRVEGTSENIYESLWVQDYITALCKITLGRIRSKFANFASVGNIGISLDGDALLSEGKEEKEKLDESLKEEEVYIGGEIMIG